VGPDGRGSILQCERATTPGGPYTTIYNISNSSSSNIINNGGTTGFFIVDNTVANGTMYCYVVSAVNLAGEGPNSVEVDAKPLPPLPATPANLTAINGDTLMASLSCTAAAGAASYNVKRATTPGGPYTVIGSSVSTNYVDSTLTEKVNTYYYVVSAVNLAGESPNSAEVSIKPSFLLNYLTKDTESYTAPAQISLHAITLPKSGSTSKVQFFNGTTLLATVTQDPFTYVWKNVPAGTYALTDIATDSAGNTSTSEKLVITVNAPAGQMINFQSSINGNSMVQHRSMTMPDRVGTAIDQTIDQ